jgi:hypothetical protein
VTRPSQQPSETLQRHVGCVDAYKDEWTIRWNGSATTQLVVQGLTDRKQALSR